LAAIGPARQLWIERADLFPPLPYTPVEFLTLISCAILLVSGTIELFRPRVGCQLALAATAILWGSFLLLEAGGTSWRMVTLQLAASVAACILTATGLRDRRSREPSDPQPRIVVPGERM
jgi:hypothetical protein